MGKKSKKKHIHHEKMNESDRAEWGECDCCGQTLPIIPETGMCGVCTFGEADAMFDW